MSTIVVISSIVQTIAAALQSVIVVFQFLFHAILGTIQAVFAALCGAISGLARTFEGLTKFLLSSMYLLFCIHPSTNCPRLRLLVQTRY
mgnify:CR=1 FL=1